MTLKSVVFGFVICGLGLWSLFLWWWSVAEILRGLVPMALIVFGLVAIGSGMRSFRKDGD
ncbi:MAG: hypothetical protein HQM13_14170 [SAR324 cluster bacterium]|nr:hypothetical protein [SAR324 cluster bacterium]